MAIDTLDYFPESAWWFDPIHFTTAEDIKRIFFADRSDITISDIIMNITDKSSGFMLSQMWMTEKPSEEYKKFINNSEENVE